MASQPSGGGTQEPTAAAGASQLKGPVVIEKIRELNESVTPNSSEFNHGKRLSWGWAFVKGDICVICHALGVSDREKRISSINHSNIVSHLAKHELTKSSPIVVERINAINRASEPDTPKLAAAVEKATQKTIALDYALVYGEPPSRIRSSLYRKLHPYFSASYAAHRKDLIAHAQKRLSQALDGLKGNFATIAIDGGTVWSHYLAVVVLVHNKGSVTIGLPRCEGSMTAAWIKSKVEHITRYHLAPRRIKPLCIVSDNAANMLAAVRACELPMLESRCAIHTLQLVVNEFFTAAKVKRGPRTVVAVPALWEEVLELMNENGMAQAPATRWNRHYMNLEAIVAPDSEITVTDTELFETMGRIKNGLELYFEATMCLQRNNATMLEAARVSWRVLIDESGDVRSGGATGVAAALRNIARRATATPGAPSRLDKILTPAIIITAYFHPGLVNGARAAVRNKLRLCKDFVRRLLISVSCHFTDRQGDVVTEFNRLHLAKPAIGPESVNASTYKTFWNGVGAYPLTGAIVRATLVLNPSEADCERVFSSVKWMFNRLRTSTAEDLVEATVCGSSAVQSIFELAEGDEEVGPCDAVQSETRLPIDRDNGEFAQFTSLHAREALDILQVFEREVLSPLEEERKRNRPANNSNVCAVCESANGECWEGRNGVDWIQCTNTECGRWFHNTCVNVDPAEIEAAPDIDWLCAGCVQSGDVL